MRNWLQQYFTFTQSERNGIIVLVLLSSVLLIAPRIYLLFRPVQQITTAPGAGDVNAFINEYKERAPATSSAETSAAKLPDVAKGDKPTGSAGNYIRNNNDANFRLDINKAGAAEFEKLRGIGSVLGARIVKFRGLLGGFAAKEQMQEVYGLPDSTYQRIKQQLVVDKADVEKLNINTAGYKTLKAHPYIKAGGARAIETYLKQHGNFKNTNELKGVLPDSSLKKLLPYLVAE